MDETTQLGHYRIVGQLGAGGMGKVYRGVDTRLGREVALKVLAPELQATEAFKRFEREARLLAALNHPNVATLYSFEESEGERFLVMELVSGQSLSQRLRTGPLPLADAVRLAGQVAEALQAAHERDIVHRDLKPANIMVLPTGVAKLLDFGIAILRPAGGHAVAADGETEAGRITGTHQILGTPAYMSPEQIRGRDVDARADIWAFGCVLFEMLAGHRLFAYDTAADTMAAILERDPNFDGLPSDVPASLRAMMRRCLQRELDNRARDIWHVRLELEDAARPLAEASPDRLCLRCGHSNSAGHQFCGHCGSSLVAECPSCGAQLGPTVAFCGACGHHLRAETTEVSSAPPMAAAGPDAVPAMTPATPRPAVSGPDSAALDTADPATTPSALTAGERRYLTIVQFALDGYAELLENLAPEQLREVIGQACDTVREVAAEYGGTVLSIEDACSTVVFGVPVSQEDDAQRAVAAALATTERVRQLLGGSDGTEPVTMRAGLATGACVTRLEESGQYSVAGDPARSAARLADQAAADHVLIAPETARLVRYDYETEAAEALTLPGSVEAVEPRYVTRQVDAEDRLGTKQSETTFTGRTRESADLEQGLAAVLAGTGRFITVVGEAGLGKSRLLDEFASHAEGTATVVYGRCHSHGKNTPYLPFLGILRAVLFVDAGDRAADEQVAIRLAEIDPELMSFLPVYLHLLAVPTERYPLPEHQEDRHLSTMIQQALAAIVTQLSVARPLVLLLEDWQWSDQGSREIVRQLGALVPGFRVLVVVTYRPEYSEDWSRLPHHAAIHLTPLAAEASTAIMQSVLQAHSVPADLAERVHSRTGGNPFFIEEVCRSLVEKRNVTVEEGQVVVQGRIEDLHLPETIQAVIRARLDRLEPFVLELVRVASVIGREFGMFLLEHVLGDAERIGDALEALQEAGLVRQARVVPDVAYRFQSALIQDVAHDTLLRHQQKALHGLVAEAIEVRHGDQLEEYADALAKHFGEAGNWRKAMRYGETAAERARSVSQFAESVAMLGRVIEWHRHLPVEEQDRDQLIDLLMRKERMYETLGRRGTQFETIEQILALVDPDVPSVHLVEAHLRLGDFYATTGRSEEAQGALVPALEWACELDDQVLERRVHRSLGFLAWQGGDDALAQESIAKAIEIDELRGEDVERAHDLTNYAATLRKTAEYERALELLEEAMALYEGLGLTTRLIEPLHVCVTLHRLAGDMEKSIEFLERARDLGRSTADAIHLHWELGNLGNIHLQLGNHDEALAAFEEAIDWARRSGYAHGLSMSLRAMGGALQAIDRPAEALPHLREAAEQFAKMHDLNSEVQTWENIAEVYADLGQRADATAARSRVLRQYREIGDQAAELGALLALAQTTRDHDVPTSQEALGDAVALAAELGDTVAHGDALNTLGILHWQAGQLEEALTSYAAALEVFVAAGDERHRGLILNSLGIVLRDLGRTDEARQRFTEALDVNRVAGERLIEGHSLAGLGDIAVLDDDHAAALDYYQQSRKLRQSIGDTAGEAWILIKCTEAALAVDDPSTAAEYASAARAIAENVDDAQLLQRINRLDALS